LFNDRVDYMSMTKEEIKEAANQIFTELSKDYDLGN
jgi:hypothetical protein